jgi:hypothetical protein
VTSTSVLTKGWRLEMCRLVRESCYTTLAGWETDDPTVLAALEVPVEIMATWFVRTETTLGNMRLAMVMVAQNLETAEAMARATGSIAVTYDGVTWQRGTLE